MRRKRRLIVSTRVPEIFCRKSYFAVPFLCRGVGARILGEELDAGVSCLDEFQISPCRAAGAASSASFSVETCIRYAIARDLELSFTLCVTDAIVYSNIFVMARMNGTPSEPPNFFLTCITLCGQMKRSSPVSGAMRRDGELDVVGISTALEKSGVAAIAVNTDRKFFGCTYDDLTSIRVGFHRGCAKFWDMNGAAPDMGICVGAHVWTPMHSFA